MNAPLIIFFVLAAMCVIGAISLILQSHPIHSALSLIVVMVALAGLYLLMGAEFVAAVQIIVYGGAIMGLRSDPPEPPDSQRALADRGHGRTRRLVSSDGRRIRSRRANHRLRRRHHGAPI